MFAQLSTTQLICLFSVLGCALALTMFCMFDIYRKHKHNPLHMMIWLQISILPFFGALAYLIKGRSTSENKHD